jgi:hypothetical protein
MDALSYAIITLKGSKASRVRDSRVQVTEARKVQALALEASLGLNLTSTHCIYCTSIVQFVLLLSDSDGQV